MAVCTAALLVGGLPAYASPYDKQGEDHWIGVLKSNADWQQKQEACRCLRQVGTAKSIPVLATLLNDEHLSHLARYALQPMPYPEVDKAFRNALHSTSGMHKMGVIISIGARRDAQAVPELVPLLKDKDINIARATAGALGRIGTEDAAKALFDDRHDAPEALQTALADGMVAAGQHLVETGKGETAASMYQTMLLEQWPLKVRMAMFRGLVYAEPAKMADRIIDALGGNDPVLRDMAAQMIADTSGGHATKQYAASLPRLSEEGRVALLRGLGGRKDPLARPAIDVALKSGDKPVKVQAVKALGMIGSADDVGTLAALLVTDDADIAAAAKDSLRNMPGTDVDKAIAEAVPQTTPDIRAQLIELLSSRTAEQAVPLAVRNLNDSHPQVRIAALKTLAQSGGAKEVAPVVDVLKGASENTERTAAAEALYAICPIQGEDALPPVLAAVQGANPDVEVVLLHCLGLIGGAKALEPVVAAVKSPDEQISSTAVRELSNWPTADAAPELLELAKSDQPARRQAGLRGYVRLARAEESLGKKTDMLNKAMGVTKSAEEKWLVLAAWGTLPTTQSLDVLLPLLDDAAMRNEAAAAIINVAGELGKKQETKAVAVDALKSVVNKCDDKDMQGRANKVLAGIQ